MKKTILLIAFMLSYFSMMAQNGLYVLRYSGSITYEKTMNEWDKIFNGQPLNQSRVLRIPSNSEIVILDKNTSRAYTYKCVMAKKITVGQIIKDVKENENGTIKRFFSLLLKSAKSKVSFFPYGATIMSSSEDPTQGFCSFLKSYFKKRNIYQRVKYHSKMVTKNEVACLRDLKFLLFSYYIYLQKLSF